MNEKINSSDGQEKDLNPPQWINKALLKHALQNSGEDVEVMKISSTVATSPGDNYGSVIYRVTAELSCGGTRTLLVKGPPPDMEKIMVEAGSFNREAVMLAEVVPKLQSLLEEAAPGRWPPLTARCPLHGADPVPFLVLEDLKEQDFRQANRVKGLGLRHALLALRTLARFHGASHVLLQREPSLEGRLDNVWRSMGPHMDAMMKGMCGATAEAVAGWAGYEEYARLIDKFKDVAAQTFLELHDPKPGKFNVVLHGDFWVNNMMFRYDEDNNPSDCRLVDLQLSHVGSPALDLLYFMSSMSENVSTHHQDLLLREYYFALQETMSLFGKQALSFETLLSEIDVNGPFVLFACLAGIPGLKANTVLDLNAMLQGDTSCTRHLYENPVVIKWYKRVLPEYRKKGWLPG